MTPEPTPIELVPLGRMTLGLAEPIVLPDTPSGTFAGTETSEPIKRNPNFGNVTRRYSPLSAQFGVRLSF